MSGPTLGSVIGHMLGAGIRASARYDIPEEEIRQLAIERAATRVRDLAEVVRRGLPGAEIRAGDALMIVAGAALDHALAQVRSEHLVPEDLPASLFSPGGAHLGVPREGWPGGRSAACASTPPSTDPHPFDPSSVGIDDGDSRARCASCGQIEDALIHHPELFPDAPDVAPGIQADPGAAP